MGEFRTINGSDNNGIQGETGVPLIRLFDNSFEDGISVPRGGPIADSTLPNPREISNIVVDQSEDVTNFLNASDWLWQWGQVLDHDFALNEDNPEQPNRDDPTIIPVLDPEDPLYPSLPFNRVPAVEGTGVGDVPREITNQLTAFIDASLVYGSEDDRAEFLRDTEPGLGLLATTIGDNGEVLLPLNLTGEDAFPNAEGGVLGEFQFIGGDIRVNEQLGLNAAHNVLVREHNRVALELNDRLEAGEEALVVKFDEFVNDPANAGIGEAELRDEFLYQSARKVVGAEIQVISYEEFVPLLIGDTLEEYTGFQADVSPQVSVEFANAAFRLGHTLLSDQLRRVGDNGISETALADAFFAPEDIQANGIDTLLTGLIFQGAQEVDNQIVDGVREFLFPAGQGGLDLASVNIARGREQGLPSYTEFYSQQFGIEFTSFDDLRSSGLFTESVVNLFEAAYETVDQIDLWVAGISELPDEHGGLLGPTLSFFVADQFTRARDGDEFFYLNDLEHLEILAPDIQDFTLSDLIANNVADPYLVPDNAFVVPFENSIFDDGGNNVLNGTDLNDLIDGQEGNDIIRGREGDDFLFGGLGNDVIRGDDGDDQLLGGDGNDVLRGNDGSDYLNGGADRDIIFAGSGEDAIRGGTGNDFLRGGGDADIFVFGSDLLDGIADTDRIQDFEAIDSFDFEGYLGAGGDIDVQNLGGFLQINLLNEGVIEDVINVFGDVDAAAAQLA